MRKPICLLLSCGLLLAGCGDEAEPTAPVAGSTATAPEPKPDRSGGPAIAGDEGRDEFENGGEGKHVPEGEPGKPDPALDEAAAVATIERYFTAAPGLETCALLSAALLRDSYGDLDGCVLAGGVAADAVEITPGRISSGSASGFEAVPEGGVYDGEPVAIDLVAGSDGWLIGRLEVDVPVGP